MSDLSSFQPIATIVAALISAAAGALATYFIIAKRKVVTFWVTETEDVTLPLRKHNKAISFKVSGREFLNLNRSEVFVKNTGNTSIADFQFDIEIPNLHHEYMAEIVVDNPDLQKAVKLNFDELRTEVDPRIRFNIVPFFNGSESFKVLVYSDGVTKDCKIHCRVQDVKTRIKSGPYMSFMDFKRAVLSEASIFGVVTVITAMISVIATSIAGATTLFVHAFDWIKGIIAVAQ